MGNGGRGSGAANDDKGGHVDITIGRREWLQDNGEMKINKSLENETLMILKLKKSTCAIYLEPVSKREEYELLLKNGIEFVIERTKNILGNKIIVARCK